MYVYVFECKLYQLSKQMFVLYIFLYKSSQKVLNYIILTEISVNDMRHIADPYFYVTLLHLLT